MTHPWPEVAALQAQAAAAFAASGWPGRKDEAFKYTSLRAVEALELPPVPVRLGVRRSVTPEIEVHDLALFEGDRAPALAHLGRLVPPTGFSAQNLAHCEPFLLHIAAGTRIEAPIQLKWRMPAGAIAHYPRLLILAEKGCDISVIELFEGEGEGPGYTHAVTELVVGEGARVRHCRFQDERPGAFHVSRLAVEVARDGWFDSTLLNGGGVLGRAETDVQLVGPGAEAHLRGLFAGQGGRHLDQHVTVAHQSHHTTSTQDFRGLLGASARGVFTGKVHVAPGAHHSAAEQQNRNLLLDPTAHVDTRPQLEILNDDVKCSHGATIGRLDEVALFYLRSRGIDQVEARRLLTGAFAAPILEALPEDALRDRARPWLEF